MKILKKELIIVIILALAFTYIAKGTANDFVADYYSSPHKTIETYFEQLANRDVVSNSFYPPGYSGSLDKFWIEYKIIEEKKTKKAGKKIHHDFVISADAVEIIVEVKMKDEHKNNPKTRFWFLLQEINKEWKIIEHSHIPDANYPAYD